MTLTAVRTEADARRHVTRIRLTASIVRENLPKLWRLIEEAKNGGDDRLLGYASWTAYVTDVFSDEPMRLPREERQQLVSMLAGEGMSTRAIAPIVGVDNKTVHNDLKRVAVVENSTPAGPSIIAPADPAVIEALDAIDQDVADSLDNDAPSPAWPDHVNLATGELPDEPATVTETHTVKVVTGLDGKSYTQTAPSAPRRSSIIDAARNAGWELRKAVERLERIQNDDRFTKNKVEILAALQPHLDFASEAISGLNDTTSN